VPVDVAAIPVQVVATSLHAAHAALPDVAPQAVREAPALPDVPARPEVASEPVRPAAPPLPAIDLALPADSTLEMVETRHRSIEPALPDAEVARPRRVRPPRVVVADEPLQMVETRHEDGDKPSA
jgi:hypothetical protein